MVRNPAPGSQTLSWKGLLSTVPTPASLLWCTIPGVWKCVKRVFGRINIQGHFITKWQSGDKSLDPSVLVLLFSHQGVRLFATLGTVASQASRPWDSGVLNGPRILEWVAIPSAWPGDRTRVSYVSCIYRQVLYHECHLGSPCNWLT